MDENSSQPGIEEDRRRGDRTQPQGVSHGPTNAIVDKKSVTQLVAQPKKGWKIATAVLLILTLGLAGVTTWLALTCDICFVSDDGHEFSDPSVCMEENSALRADVEADRAVREVVEVLDEKIQELATLNVEGTTYYATWYPVYDYLNPIYQPADVYGLVSLDKAYGATVPLVGNEQYVERFDDGLQVLTDVLLERGFERYEPYEEQVMYTPVQFLNAETGVLCFVESGMPFTYSCGHISNIGAEHMELVKELGAAMERAGHSMALFRSEIEIRNSEVAPYQKIETSIGGAIGLFYRTSSEAEWQFFTGVQAVLGCDEFNTDDLRKAFAGEACYDYTAGRDSTVQP